MDAPRVIEGMLTPILSRLDTIEARIINLEAKFEVVPAVHEDRISALETFFQQSVEGDTQTIPERLERVEHMLADLIERAGA